jgi:hypothetical protein
VVAILFVPIGLLALLADKAHYNITATFRPAEGGSTAIVLTGVIPRKVAIEVADRTDEFDPAVDETHNRGNFSSQPNEAQTPA